MILYSRVQSIIYQGEKSTKVKTILLNYEVKDGDPMTKGLKGRNNSKAHGNSMYAFSIDAGLISKEQTMNNSLNILM